ncbi:MAG: DUF6519 domain-containing protein [Stenomitos frigidus ULC029]
MKGDFTRSTFRFQNHYSSVRMQQGRLQLDADWNEQIDIQRHLLQMQARDMIGHFGVPLADPSTALSFQIDITDDRHDLTINPGRIYVDGILCELEPGSRLSFTQKQTQSADAIEVEVPTLLVDGQNLAPGQWIELFATSADSEVEVTPVRVRIDKVDPTQRQPGYTVSFNKPAKDLPPQGQLRRILTWKTQPDCPQPDFLTSDSQPWITPTLGKTYLAYLDVWQRHLTAMEEPQLREVALNLPDTATRTKTVWQIKLLELKLPEEQTSEAQRQQRLITLQSRKAALRVRVIPGLSQSSANSVRRLENQLYRVEIHSAGEVGTATFKWSRDNGAIASTIKELDDTIANVMTIAPPVGRETSQLFAPNQWVEITDEARELQEIPGTLVRLTAATAGTKLVFQKARDRDGVNLKQFPIAFKPKVRRWDHTTPAAEIPTTAGQWIPLGNEGIEVWFEAESQYKTGDYWLIPARTVTNNIEWTRDDSGNPLPQEIQGTLHAYCRLAVLHYGDQGFTLLQDDRQGFAALADCLPLQGGTITGSLTVAKALNANQFTSETLTVKSGQINSPHQLSLQIEGKDQLTIASITGNVGVGLSAPKAKLHVAAPTEQAQILRLSAGDRFVDVGTSDDSLVQFQTNCKGYQFDEDIRVATGAIGSINAQHLFLRTGATNRLTILQDSGRIGIGTDHPLTKLHIAATPEQASTLRLSQSDHYVDLELQPDHFVGFQTSGTGYQFDKPLFITSGSLESPDRFTFRISGTPQLTVLNNGNVGIGTEQPAAKLHVVAPVNQQPALRLEMGDRYLNLTTENNWLHCQTNVQGYHFDQSLTVGQSLTVASGIVNSSSDLQLNIANKPQLKILQSNGNVGIGSDTPTAKLHIVTAADEVEAVRLTVGDRQLDLGIQADAVQLRTNGKRYNFDQGITVQPGIFNSAGDLLLQTGGTSQVTILRDSGNVGIGTTTPEAKLQLIGNAKFEGTVVHSDSPQVAASRVQKENIVDFASQEAADLLKALHPVKFTHRADPSQQPQAGFLAEDVPSLVASTDGQAVRMMEIIAILTQNIKNHEQTIVTLTQQTTQQQAMIDGLVERVAPVERRNRNGQRQQRSWFGQFSRSLTNIPLLFRRS